jgi:nicotinate-nucleotide adenylyltransferase
LKIALFGGTFDPVHEAHLTVAREALEACGLDRVWFVPAAHPPHKTATHAPYKDRVRMLELACEGEPRFEVSRIEEGEAQSYTIRTLERIRRGPPDDEIHFLIGADAFSEIETWYRWRDVVQGVRFIVVSRPGHEYRTPEGARVARLETLALPVSSSDIRQRLASGETPPEVPPPVGAYIRERGLYGAQPLR